MDDIRSGKFYPLAPLLVLLTKKPDQDTLLEERELIVKHEPDPIRRRTLFVTAILTALGEKMFDPDFLWSFFKEKDMLLREDPVLNRWFNELYGDKLAEAEAARREAEAEAEAARREAEAAAEAARRDARLFTSVIKYLAQRFSHIPTQLLLDLQNIPSKQYQQAMDLALDAADLEAFEQEVKALLSNGGVEK